MSARYDAEAGAWMVPISDSLLDLLSGEWSEPVQLKAIPADDGWDIVLRPACPAA